MRLNVIFMTQKWLVTGVVVLVASISNAQTYVIEFLNESAGVSTTPVSIFELPPPWSAASQAVGATVGVGNNKNESYAKLGVRVRTTANGLIAGVQVTRVSCTAAPGYEPDDSTVHFGAGMGDAILFGQGRRVRDMLKIDGGVNLCSDEYSAGDWAGLALSLATGISGGLRGAGAKGAGKEFSHWIPNRMNGPRSIWNGNFVPVATHALTDPYRYRFMPKSWKALNPMPNIASQQWTRIPNVYKGVAAGSAYGAAGAALSGGCACR